MQESAIFGAVRCRYAKVLKGGEQRACSVLCSVRESAWKPAVTITSWSDLRSCSHGCDNICNILAVQRSRGSSKLLQTAV